MPGTVIFRPLQAKLGKDEDALIKMDPYCKIKLGWHTAKTSAAKHSGLHPKWSEEVVLERKHDEEFAKLKIKDKERPGIQDLIGETKIDLNAVASQGKVRQWYNLYQDKKVTGEVLLEIQYDKH